MEFGTISVSDGISMRHEGMRASLVSREVIAGSVVSGMHANILRDWLSAIEQCAPDELEAMVRDGLAAATEVKDREAFVAIRAAGQKRTKALEATA